MDNRASVLTLWDKVCAKDDIGAYETLFHKLNHRLIQFCVLYVHQVEVAEEIVSDVFIKCWQNRKRMVEILNLETYLFVAVKNHSLNYIKKYSNIHFVPVEDTRDFELVNVSDPQKELEIKELAFKMDQAVLTLPLQARLIFRLIKEDGMKYKEVAEILNISPRTVQTQLYRSVKKLSAIFCEYQTKASPRTKTVVSLAVIAAALQLFFYFL
jgi:RNA polymerase sigma-70 factor (family 1)